MAMFSLSAAPHSTPLPPLDLGGRVRASGAEAIRLWPGLALCVAVSAAAMGLQDVETRLFGRAWLEALVIAILLGATIRTCWAPALLWRPGVDFSARILLESAIVLLGASASARTVWAVGPGLLVGIVGVVAIAIAASYGLGRLLGLPHRLATLIACGNAICGNSAIAAVAPAIGADGEDVAASIAFTAVMGVGVVLGLPMLAAWLGLSPRSFGVFAGLTVYAVPQVLAATAPAGVLSAQVGTLVKLVRVLMLGPVVLIVSLLTNRSRPSSDVGGGSTRQTRPVLKIHQLAPWFIVGFLGMMSLRSADLIPAVVLAPTADAARALTIVSMAALGLGVDARVVARAGVRFTIVVLLSIAGLGLIALLLIRLLGLR